MSVIIDLLLCSLMFMMCSLMLIMMLSMYHHFKCLWFVHTIQVRHWCYCLLLLSFRIVCVNLVSTQSNNVKHEINEVSIMVPKCLLITRNLEIIDTSLTWHYLIGHVFEWLRSNPLIYVSSWFNTSWYSLESPTSRNTY